MNASSDPVFAQAMVLLRAGNLPEAEQHFRTLLKQDPNHVAALNLIGIVLTQQGKFAEAEIFIRRAIGIDASSDVTFYNYGTVLKNLDRPQEALEAFQRAIVINPAVPESWNNRGTVFNDLKRYKEAVVDFKRAVVLKPDYAEAFSNLGKSLFLLSRSGEALEAYKKALALMPNRVDAWIGYANVLGSLDRFDEALVACDEAIKLNPNVAEAWAVKGNLFGTMNRDKEAVLAYDRALALKPNLDFLQGNRLHTKFLICDWNGLEADCERVIAGVRTNIPVATPFSLLGFPSSAEDELNCARTYVFKKIASEAPLWRGEKYSHERIRVAYLSADFRDHAVAHLIAGVFEHHDRNRFDLTAISLCAKDGSALQNRIRKSFDRYVEGKELSDHAIANIIREAEIDIAVDLTGYTKNARTNVFAARPAPVQVNYLGYPGTMGADFIDYIIADDILIPEQHSKFYSEKIIRMPDTYQATDNKRSVSARNFTRSEAGLPESGFVFCSFNNSFKITPDVFDSWMRLLHRVKHSVLWLISGNSDATQNLKLKAQEKGISPDRLIFAPRMNSDEHLARHRLADLCLDTLPYNGHTTTSDALWAGSPVITRLGSTFAGRVAASILTAAGLPELITGSQEEYEALALQLATDPGELASIKAKLAKNRTTFPLFDTAQYTRYLETAYGTMWERARKGEAPKNFRVRPE